MRGAEHQSYCLLRNRRLHDNLEGGCDSTDCGLARPLAKCTIESSAACNTSMCRPVGALHAAVILCAKSMKKSLVAPFTKIPLYLASSAMKQGPSGIDKLAHRCLEWAEGGYPSTYRPLFVPPRIRNARAHAHPFRDKLEAVRARLASPSLVQTRSTWPSHVASSTS